MVVLFCVRSFDYASPRLVELDPPDRRSRDRTLLPLFIGQNDHRDGRLRDRHDPDKGFNEVFCVNAASLAVVLFFNLLHR